MSYAFTLEGIDSLSLSSIVVAMGNTAIHFVEGFPKPQSGRWPVGRTRVFRHLISARPVEVDYDSTRLQVRILAPSSPEDYRLALNLVAAVAQVHGVLISPQSCAPVALQSFRRDFDAAWIRDHCETQLASTISRHLGNPDWCQSIELVHKSARLGPRILGQVLQQRDNLEGNFFARLRTLNYLHLEDVYHAANRTLENRAGNLRVRIATYTEGVPTLFRDKHTLVHLIDDREVAAGKIMSSNLVPLDQLSELLGEQAQWLSEDLLLAPGVSGDAWTEIKERAQAVKVENIFEHGVDPACDPYADYLPAEGERLGNLTREEWMALAYAPIVVFGMIAADGGRINKREARDFQEQLLHEMASGNRILARATLHAVTNFDEMIGRLLRGEVSFEAKMVEILSVLHRRLSHAEADAFKQALMQLGEALACASGGFLGVLSRSFHQREANALSMLRGILATETPVTTTKTPVATNKTPVATNN